MLDRIGDEGFFARDPRVAQSLVEYPARRADEGLAGEVFLVPWLLTDQHEGRAMRPLAWHGLGSLLVKRTTSAILLGRGELAQGFERCIRLVRHRDRTPSSQLRCKDGHKGIFMSLVPPRRPRAGERKRPPAAHPSHCAICLTLEKNTTERPKD